MPPFSEIIDDIIDGVRTLADTTVRNYANEALADATDFLESSREKLERWTRLLAVGELTIEDFEWLIQSQADLAKMHALKESGLALVRVDAFKYSLLNVITDTIFRAVL